MGQRLRQRRWLLGRLRLHQLPPLWQHRLLRLRLLRRLSQHQDAERAGHVCAPGVRARLTLRGAMISCRRSSAFSANSSVCERVRSMASPLTSGRGLQASQSADLARPAAEMRRGPEAGE